MELGLREVGQGGQGHGQDGDYAPGLFELRGAGGGVSGWVESLFNANSLPVRPLLSLTLVSI